MQPTINVKIPATRDPFVNTHLVPAGIDMQTGEERFWISSWNSNSGSTGVLVTSSGKSRIFRFDYSRKQFGFYGAAYGGNDIMWLNGCLAEVVMLDLNTGETKSWSTGFPRALAFNGMAYDGKTGKLFASAYCQEDLQCKGFSFDTRKKEIVARYENINARCNYVKNSIENNDGTFTLLNVTPGIELLLWDPSQEKLEVVSESFEAENASLSMVKRDDGVIYLPSIGWFAPSERKLVDGPRPSREASWFACKGNTFYGAVHNPVGTVVVKWNIEGSEVTQIAEIPDSGNFCLTSRGKLVCVNVYGFFYSIDPETRSIECSIKLETDSVGHMDCLHRINGERLLCTPFITQRFFEIDLKTGRGFDLGRATAGGGEVLQVTELDGKIYMASYTKGQLVEYDPYEHAYFPENPRVVVHPPHGSMRPVGMCRDGSSIYYSCSHEYGNLGSIMIKYSPSQCVSAFKDNPVPNQMLRSIWYDSGSGSIIAGTTYHADCRSCKPTEDRCMLVKLSSGTLLAEKTVEAPENYSVAEVFGLLKDGTYLCCFGGDKGERMWASLEIEDMQYAEFQMPEQLAGGKAASPHYAEKPGWFVISDGNTVDLWDLGKGEKVRNICSADGFYRLHVQDRSLYLVYRQEIKIYEDCL